MKNKQTKCVPEEVYMAIKHAEPLDCWEAYDEVWENLQPVFQKMYKEYLDAHTTQLGMTCQVPKVEVELCKSMDVLNDVIKHTIIRSVAEKLLENDLLTITKIINGQGIEYKMSVNILNLNKNKKDL